MPSESQLAAEASGLRRLRRLVPGVGPARRRVRGTGEANPAVRLPGAHVWVGGPVPPGADAITLGRLIIVRRSAAGDEKLLRHEHVHVRQWRRYGVVGFLARYLAAYFRWRLRGYGHWAAYRRIPLEIEAEWVARQEMRR